VSEEKYSLVQSKRNVLTGRKHIHWKEGEKYLRRMDGHTVFEMAFQREKTEIFATTNSTAFAASWRPESR
jgi:hypothetical protein